MNTYFFLCDVEWTILYHQDIQKFIKTSIWFQALDISPSHGKGYIGAQCTEKCYNGNKNGKFTMCVELNGDTTSPTPMRQWVSFILKVYLMRNQVIKIIWAIGKQVYLVFWIKSDLVFVHVFASHWFNLSHNLIWISIKSARYTIYAIHCSGWSVYINRTRYTTWILSSWK